MSNHFVIWWLASHLYRLQLVRDIGITHGDETRVGYYVGILVRHFRKIEESSSLSPFGSTGIHFLSLTGPDYTTLEQTVRSHWPKACHLYQPVWSHLFDVVLWSIKIFLRSSVKVRI
jgi:hypothetical protein